jgi:hypothetical protein
MKIKIVFLALFTLPVFSSEQQSFMKRVAMLYIEIRDDVTEKMLCGGKNQGSLEKKIRDEMIPIQCQSFVQCAWDISRQYQKLIEIHAASERSVAEKLKEDMDGYEDIWKSEFSQEEIAIVSVFPLIMFHGSNASPEKACLLFRSLKENYPGRFDESSSLMIPESTALDRV